MTDHKFTDDQIIRGLNECDGKENVVAHIVDQGEDELVTLGRILEIINRQKAEIEALTNAVDNSTKEFLSLHDAYQDQKAEIERLQKHNTEFARKHYSDGYNEAVKKFAERLKIMAYPFPCAIGVEYAVPIRATNDLVQEMTAGYTENSSPENDYFTPEEVRKMSQSEVRKNYQVIINSMPKWGKDECP